MAEIGHNQPPLVERLARDHDRLVKRQKELIEAAKRVPSDLNDEDAQKMTRFIKQIQNHGKDIEQSRVEEKDPFLRGGQAVDKWFGDMRRQMDALAKSCKDSLAKYQKAVEAARQAEIKRQQAEARRREEEARRAEEEARRAQEAAAAKQREIERKQREEADAEERARLETERQARLREEEQARQAARELQHRQQVEQVRQKQAEAERSAAAAPMKTAVGTAKLKSRWVCREWDRGTVDLEALRHYFTQTAIDAAVRSYVAKGGRHLAGATIVEETTSVVR